MKKKFDGEHLFFTSDTHFGHKNIIPYCSRPYNDVEEMNKALIENWNKTVSPKDDIIILGDFYWQPKKQDWINTLNQLNGHKYLIVGNHDQNIPEEMFEWVKEIAYISIKDSNGITNYACLCHYPLIDWGRRQHGCVNLHGHLHTGRNINCEDLFGKDLMRLLSEDQYDVGVDNNNYTPVSWKEVYKQINTMIIV